MQNVVLKHFQTQRLGAENTSTLLMSFVDTISSPDFAKQSATSNKRRQNNRKNKQRNQKKKYHVTPPPLFFPYSI